VFTLGVSTTVEVVDVQPDANNIIRALTRVKLDKLDFIFNPCMNFYVNINLKEDANMFKGRE
jgi:hypothetical protein